ncbi:MAG: GNAT family N-acetyltransferase [Alphaproteobacteria bacterium]|jgi:putative acetyltransferase|nr:GNAT family N-acetyltransferase [Alphaproteobacteria bacterium]
MTGTEPAAAGGAGQAEPLVRPACDDDADGLIALIGACFADYPGCVLDVDGEMPHLRAIATAFARRRGRAWVAESDGMVVGVVGVRPAGEPRTMELMTLYVGHAVRRRGLGARLVGLAEAESRQRGAVRMELWSDTRFTEAHRLYEGLGYRRLPETRALHDLSDTVEFHFVKALGA